MARQAVAGPQGESSSNAMGQLQVSLEAPLGSERGSSPLSQQWQQGISCLAQLQGHQSMGGE